MSRATRLSKRASAFAFLLLFLFFLTSWDDGVGVCVSHEKWTYFFMAYLMSRSTISFAFNKFKLFLLTNFPKCQTCTKQTNTSVRDGGRHQSFPKGSGWLSGRAADSFFLLNESNKKKKQQKQWTWTWKIFTNTTATHQSRRRVCLCLCERVSDHTIVNREGAVGLWKGGKGGPA